MFLMSKVTVTIQQALCAVIGQVWRSEKSRQDLISSHNLSIFFHFFHIFFCHCQYVQMSADPLMSSRRHISTIQFQIQLGYILKP